MNAPHFQLRYRIMVFLYAAFQEHPGAAVDIRDMEEGCRTTAKELNWNLAYLEKCGYVELGTSEIFPPYIASLVALTATGIDLVENEEQCRQRFHMGESTGSPPSF